MLKRDSPGIGRELADSHEISFHKIGVLVENLLLGHPDAKPTQNIPDRNPESTNARLSASFLGSMVILSMLAAGVEKTASI